MQSRGTQSTGNGISSCHSRCTASQVGTAVKTRPIKRIALSDLHKPENWMYRAGSFPVIITGLKVAPRSPAGSWRDLESSVWSPRAMLDFFQRSSHPNFDAHVNGIADSVGDFLPRGEDENIAQYFQRVLLDADLLNTSAWQALARATPDIATDAAQRYAEAGVPQPLQGGGRRLVDVPYISTSDSVAGIRQLLSPVGYPRPPQMQAAETWLQACMPHPRLQDGWLSGTSWRLLLLGGIGSGSSIHDDHIPTASWQVQLTGAKSWIICPPDRWGLGARKGRGTLDIFAPDYAAERLPADFSCQMGTVHAGEMAWYPAKWLHATVNTKAWSMGFTGSEVELGNVEAVAAQMEHKINVHHSKTMQAGADAADMSFMPYTGSARQLAPRCFDWWRQGLTGQYSSVAQGSNWEAAFSCSEGDRKKEQDAAAQLVEENRLDDDAELESVAG